MKSKTKKNVLFLASALATVVLAGGIGATAQISAKAAETEATTFEMLYGASVRATDPTGLRFKVKLGSQYYGELTAENATSELHVALIPYSYYEAYKADGQKGEQALYPWLVNAYGEDNILEVQIPSEKIYYTTDEVTGESYYCANAVISNVFFNNYHLDFVGVAYVENGTNYTDATVTEEANARSIFEVAYLATQNPETYTEYKDFLDETMEKGMYYAYGVRYSQTNKNYVYDGQTYETYEEVKEVASIDVDQMKVSVGDLLTKVGATYDLNAKVTFADGTAYTKDAFLTWEVEDETVATVENGVVTAKKAGETTVTVSAFGGKYTDTCKVTVAEAVVEKTYTVMSADGITCSNPNVSVSLPADSGGQLYMNANPFDGKPFTIYVPLPETYITLKSIYVANVWTNDGGNGNYTAAWVGEASNPNATFIDGTSGWGGSWVESSYTATSAMIQAGGYANNKNQVAITIYPTAGSQVVFLQLKFTYEAPHVHGEYTYVDNGNGTYNETCGCGEVKRVLTQITYTAQDLSKVSCSDSSVSLSGSNGKIEASSAFSTDKNVYLTFTLPETYVVLTKIFVQKLKSFAGVFAWVGETHSENTRFIGGDYTWQDWYEGNYTINADKIAAAGYTYNRNQVTIGFYSDSASYVGFENISFTYLVEHTHTQGVQLVDNGNGTYSEKYACCGVTTATYRAEEKTYTVMDGGVTCSDPNVSLTVSGGQIVMNSSFSAGQYVTLTFTLPETYAVLTKIHLYELKSYAAVFAWIGDSKNDSTEIIGGDYTWEAFYAGNYTANADKIAAAGYTNDRNQVSITFESQGGSQVVFHQLTFTYVVLTKI